MDLSDDEKAVIEEYRKYKDATARAFFGGRVGSAENFDKARYIGRMNHEAGHFEADIMADLREAAEAAGWSIEDYMTDEEADR